MNDPIERLTDELREDTSQPRVDWDAVDEKLFARVRAEIAAERAATRPRFAARVWLPAAAVLAAAAAIALVVGRDREAKPVASNAVQIPRTTPSAAAPAADAAPVITVVSIAPGAEVLVDGRVAKKGARVVDGSRVETRGGRALFARDAGTAMVVDSDSRARVTRESGTLLVALERGALEAKVDGSAGAFAVGIADARVTTQASHVRVARSGVNVVVDVTEGTVAIGDSAIDSPAHAELSSADVNGSLRIDHAPASVRPAISFAIELPEEAPSAPLNPSSAAVAPTLAAAAPSSTPQPAPSPETLPASGPAASQSPAIASAPASESAVANAVRACLAARPAATGVKVSVSTTVKLSVASNGAVTLARFDPPIAPEAQSCAAATIYKVRFPIGGDRAIAVDFKHEK